MIPIQSLAAPGNTSGHPTDILACKPLSLQAVQTTAGSSHLADRQESEFCVTKSPHVALVYRSSTCKKICQPQG